MDQQQRKAALKGWKYAELTNLIDGMPLAPEQLHRLLDYLGANLKVCDHTTKLTAIFLHVEKLEKDKVLSWLAEHGGFCDCEVLANLADFDDSMRRPPPAPRVVPPKQRTRVPRSLGGEEKVGRKRWGGKGGEEKVGRKRWQERMASS